MHLGKVADRALAALLAAVMSNVGRVRRPDIRAGSNAAPAGRLKRDRRLPVLLAAAMSVGALAVPPGDQRTVGPGGAPGPEPGPPAHSGSAVRPYPKNPVKVRIEHCAHEGEQAFGLPEGVTFSYLDGAQIDCLGNVLFNAWLSGPGVTTANDWAIFYGQPGSISKVIQESDPAPCMPDGVIVSSLYYAGERLSETAPGCVSDDEPGWISLTIDVSGPGITPGVDDRIFYAGPPYDLRPVLRGVDQAPGCEPGVYIDVSPAAGFGGTISDHATLLVCAQLAGPGVTTWNDRACWTGTRDCLLLAVRTGMQAPDCAAGVTFSWVDLSVHNDAGQLTFRGGLRGTGVTSANNAGRWMFDPALGLIKVARMGDPVPWFGGAQSWEVIGGSLGTINALGLTGESGGIEGEGVTSENNAIAVAGEPESLQVLGREGDPVMELGAEVYIAGFGVFWINNRNEVLYPVKLRGAGITSANQRTMYFGRIGAAKLAMREGDSAPTFPPGVVLTNLLNMQAAAAMNDVGGVVGPTCIQGPGVIEDVNHVVLWMRHHVLKRWIPLLRSGDLIEGRTVWAGYELDFAVCRSGGADGNPQSLNDRGMVAAAFPFTDGTYGVYRLCPILADADRDGDLDADDWALLPACLDAAGTTLSQDCSVFDLNADGHLDLIDVGMLQELFQDQP